MADIVDIGSAANDGTGDPLRTAMQKINAEFERLGGLAIYNGAAYSNEGAWTTTTVYAVNDLVTNGGVVYVCQIAHTAGTFATDLAAGKWTIHQGITAAELATTAGADAVGFESSLPGASPTTVNDYLHATETHNRAMRFEAGIGTSVYTRGSFIANEVIDDHAWYAFLNNSQTDYGGAVGTIGQAVFADNGTLSGSTGSDHYHSFQAYPKYNVSATLGRMSGFWSQPDVQAGTVTELSQFKASNALSAGTVTTQYGLLVEALTRGASNWGVFVTGPTPSHFGGRVNFGSAASQYGYIEYNSDGALDIKSRATYKIRLISKVVAIGDSGDSFAATLDNNADGHFYVTARSGYKIKLASAVEVSGPLALPTYTVSTLPSASANARGLIYVSNETGGATTAFSDGTNWRRHADRAVVS